MKIPGKFHKRLRFRASTLKLFNRIYCKINQFLRETAKLNFSSRFLLNSSNRINCANPFENKTSQKRG